MEKKYDGIATFKIGEAARRAGVNKETIDTMSGVILSRNQIQVFRIEF